MKTKVIKAALTTSAIVFVPVLLAFTLLHLWRWDFTIPLAYSAPGADEIWQLVATKTLLDTGWVLNNPYLGAPAISAWYNNSGSQTSALHSVLMLFLSVFIKDAVAVQQTYFIINFVLITASGFLTCRVFRVAKLPAALAGLCFAFTSYRLHFLFFAYLTNYFIVPISIIPSVWILQGALGIDDNRLTFVRRIFAFARQKRFWWSALIICTAAVTDGYYAFFTLLLLGYSTLISLVVRDFRRPLQLIAPCVLVLSMLVTVEALNYPIHQFRSHHPEQADQDRLKLPTDAEVYSSSLKVLVAPISDHRIPALARFGEYLVETANFNRRFPYPRGAVVPLSLMSTLVMFVLFVTWMAKSIRPRPAVSVQSQISASEEAGPTLVPAIAALTLFVLLCSVSGGLGSLIAIVFPSIRAYERFPIYIIFMMFLLAAYVATPWVSTGRVRRRLAFSLLVTLVAGLCILDETPSDLLGLSTADGRLSRETRFVAERTFVRQIEKALKPDALVYQYPYSQYLSDNPYYGWGAFGQLRLYLHSRSLHWSNGNAKGSPADDWHERIAKYPIPDLLQKIEAAGFTGFVVDRMVVPDSEYVEIRDIMATLVGPPLESEAARLAFWRLPELPYTVVYAEDFKQLRAIEVHRDFDVKQQHLPSSIDPGALSLAMHAPGTTFPVVYTAEAHPQMFRPEPVSNGTFGLVKITDMREVVGDLTCTGASKVQSTSDTLKLRLDNHSDFDWLLGQGEYPLRIGAIVSDQSGKHLEDMFDLTKLLIKHGEGADIDYSLKGIFPASAPRDLKKVKVDFGFLQLGNAWFPNHDGQPCSVVVERQ